MAARLTAKTVALLSRAARPARPSCLGPGKGRENDPARPNGKEISMTRALSEPLTGQALLAGEVGEVHLRAGADVLDDFGRGERA